MIILEDKNVFLNHFWHPKRDTFNVINPKLMKTGVNSHKVQF